MDYFLIIAICVLCVVALISTVLIDEIIQRGIYAVAVAISAIRKLLKRT